jgi:hypothetical protein
MRPAILGDDSVHKLPFSFPLLVMLPFNPQQQRTDRLSIVRLNSLSPASNRFSCLPSAQTNPETRHSPSGV